MKKLFWGLLFVTAAAAVIVSSLGYFSGVNLFGILCTIFLIPIFIKSIIGANYAGVFFPLAFIGIIYSGPLGIDAITPLPILLAALLLSIGFSIMFKKNYKCYSNKENFDSIVNETDESNIDFRVSFGSSIKYINSDDFKYANLSCSFGAMKVYFDNAKIVESNAVVNLDISFSGVELFIPSDWKVINNVDISMGGLDEKNKPGKNTEKTITLTGKVNLSGVEIIYI